MLISDQAYIKNDILVSKLVKFIIDLDDLVIQEK